MNAYLVSRFLHAFPSEKPPTQPPQSKDIQIVSWTVEQPLQTLSFEDATWATQWCQQQGIDPNSLQYHQKNVPHERFQALEICWKSNKREARSEPCTPMPRPT